MKIDLTVGGEEFWVRLETDLRAARRSVRIQTLSFEGDRAGLALAEALLRSSAPDRRILVDHYTRFILSDRFLYAPAALLDRSLRAEARGTREMIETLRDRGVGVNFMNPVGPLLHRLAARNHKKIVVIDERIAYLGGINFSEHNFDWHDMMLRFEDDRLARFLAEDFDATWSGVDRAGSACFGNVELHLWCGAQEDAGPARLLRMIDEAESEIHVHSPYLSFPFLGRLADAVRRGVAVHVITPDQNNYRTAKEYVLAQAAKAGMTVWLYPERMMHLKALLVDGRTLVVGSSNFDWLGFSLCQEVIAVVGEPQVVAAFRERVLEEDLRRSARFSGSIGRVRGRIAEVRMHAAAGVLGALARIGRRQAGSVTNDDDVSTP